MCKEYKISLYSRKTRFQCRHNKYSSANLLIICWPKWSAHEISSIQNCIEVIPSQLNESN